MLEYQHQWEPEQKNIYSIKVSKVDKSNWVKTIEAIIFDLKFVREVQGILLAYVVNQYNMAIHILVGYDTYFNLDKEMIVRTP